MAASDTDMAPSDTDIVVGASTDIVVERVMARSDTDTAVAEFELVLGPMSGCMCMPLCRSRLRNRGRLRYLSPTYA